MLRNQPGQKLRVFAFNRLTNAPVPGDAAHITCQVSIDYEARVSLNDEHPTEESPADADGLYFFELVKAETDGAALWYTPRSSTSNVSVIVMPEIRTTTQACGCGDGAVAALQGQEQIELLQTLVDGLCPPRR